jgi:hypothetical protein
MINKMMQQLFLETQTCLPKPTRLSDYRIKADSKKNGFVQYSFSKVLRFMKSQVRLVFEELFFIQQY